MIKELFICVSCGVNVFWYIYIQLLFRLGTLATCQETCYKLIMNK